jgi:hypothetical protein
MTARRFPFELRIAGMTIVGECDLDNKALGEDPSEEHPAPPREIRPRGRPSFYKLLSTAVAAFPLDPRQPIAERARKLHAHLEEAGLDPQDDLPSLRCIEEFLARRKLTKKSPRAKKTPRRG